jgi:hypothetical protein
MQFGPEDGAFMTNSPKRESATIPELVEFRTNTGSDPAYTDAPAAPV